MHTKFPSQRWAGVDPANQAYFENLAKRPTIQESNDERDAIMDARDPTLRNWNTANFGPVGPSGSHEGRMPNDSQWTRYFDVLADRGAQMAQPGASLRGLRQSAQTSGPSTDELIEGSQMNRQRGAKVRQTYGGVVGANETGRII